MRLHLSRVLPLLTASAVLMAATLPADHRLALMEAMAAEMTRNQQQLKLQGHEPPYFMSYQLKDYDQYAITARYGAIFLDDGYRNRQLSADVRVGTYEFDSSVPEEMDFIISSKGTSFYARTEGPLDESAVALRTSLWLMTDEKYKNALVQFLKKKGEDVYAVVDPKRPPSFSREKPNTHVQPPVAFPFDRERWRRVARDVSARFNSYPELFDSDVRVTADKVVRVFVSTEGSRIISEETLYGLHVSAVARAEDGQLLDNSRTFYSPTEAGLPDEKKLMAAADKVIEELLALRMAPAIDPYTGPAILAPEASGVLFHETVGHRLEGHRQGDDREGKTFRGQEDKQILPPFISIHDDPSLRVIGDDPLNGYYLFDEEGVKGQRVTLVDKGVLKNYLLSRQPIEGFLQSNGHGRSQGNRRPVARMANLIVESTKKVSDEQLKKMLIAEAKRQGKPYGLIIRDITGGNTNTSSYGYQAFKGVPRMVYRVDVRDGKETLVRGVEIVGTPLSSMNRILATGSKPGIFNGFCGAESGNVPVSTVAPAALLQEIELQRTVEGKDRPPILMSPAAATTTQPEAKAPPEARK